MKFYLYNTYKKRYEEDETLPGRFTFALSQSGHNIIKFSFIIINNLADGYIYIGKVYNKQKITTFEYRYSINDVRIININLDKLIKNIQPKNADQVLGSEIPVLLHENNSLKIMNAILKNNSLNIDESYFTFQRILSDEYSDVLPQFIDSFYVAFKLFGIDPKDIPPLTEEQILDFDIDTIFQDKVMRTPDGKHYFYYNQKRLYLQKVHNTSIEKCLGVDLIYNFIDEQRMLFIQYKCINQEKKKFYKSSDPNLLKQMDKMKSISGISNCYNYKARSRDILRICNCPAFIKLCSREIKEKRIAPYGFYYPLCIWNHIYNEKKKYITLDDKPRISNLQFIELVKSGLLGSTPDQTKFINMYLVAKSKDKRLKLVFTEIKEE